MFKLTIKTDNAAFEDDPTAEVARILRALADRMEGASSDEAYLIHDINGNRVGQAAFTGHR